MAQRVQNSLITASPLLPSLHPCLGWMVSGECGDLRGTSSSASINLSSLLCIPVSFWLKRCPSEDLVEKFRAVFFSCTWACAVSTCWHLQAPGGAGGAHVAGAFASVFHRCPISCSWSPPARKPYFLVSSKMLMSHQEKLPHTVKFISPDYQRNIVTKCYCVHTSPTDRPYLARTQVTFHLECTQVPTTVMRRRANTLINLPHYWADLRWSHSQLVCQHLIWSCADILIYSRSRAVQPQPQQHTHPHTHTLSARTRTGETEYLPAHTYLCLQYVLVMVSLSNCVCLCALVVSVDICVRPHPCERVPVCLHKCRVIITVQPVEPAGSPLSY